MGSIPSWAPGLQPSYGRDWGQEGALDAIQVGPEAEEGGMGIGRVQD